jgi:arylsulfatase A-like enzyme
MTTIRVLRRICRASRRAASLLTGRIRQRHLFPRQGEFDDGVAPHNHGMLSVHHTVDKDQGLLRTDKKHWAMCLAENGYHNAYFGKWHVENTESPGTSAGISTAIKKACRF